MASIQKKNNKYCVVYYCKDIKQIQQFIVGTIGIAHIDEQGDFSTAQGTEVHLMWIGEHFECSF